jgi:ABC-2 type transport system ATP-binding protein
MAALSLQGVSFRYPRGEEDVLRDVSLDIGSGGVLGLLGPNGAGKTTLISILAGQLRGASGRVRVDGSLGLVPQELAFYPMLTCRENLRFFGAVQGLQGGRLSQRIAAVAGLARIEAVLARRAGELSGGLKRRLNLAIGLLTAPEIILLDEPTVGVDPQSRAFLLDTIRSLAGPGRIVLYTSHYMEEVQAICNRVVIMDHGRVLISGSLDEILHDASGVLELRLRSPLPPALAVDWRSRFALQDDGGCRYRLHLCQPGALGQALEAARAAGCEPIALGYGRRDLEQVFMQLTQRSLRD